MEHDLDLIIVKRRTFISAGKTLSAGTYYRKDIGLYLDKLKYEVVSYQDGKDSDIEPLLPETKLQESNETGNLPEKRRSRIRTSKRKVENDLNG